MTASSKNIAGDRFTWIVGTKDPDYEFDPSSCSDNKVVTFQPSNPRGEQLRIMKGFGLYTEPLFESAFYADLAAKTLAAVTKMKKGVGGLGDVRVESNP